MSPSLILQIATPDSIPIVITSVAVIALLLMLVMGAILSAAEIAFFNLDSRDVNYLKSKTDSTSLYIVELIERPKALSSVLKSVKIACIIIGVGISLFIANTLLPEHFNIWVKAAILLVTNIIMILLVIEIMPKVYARRNKLRLLLFAIPVIRPLFLLLKGVVARNDRRSDIEDAYLRNLADDHTEINLRDALEARLGHEPSEEEYNIFNGILKFGSLTVKQVMTSRMDISAINIDYTTEQVLSKVHQHRLSRMPIYKDNIDNITGVLFTKDLLTIDNTSDTASWKDRIRSILFVPETKQIEDLFQEFQDKRTHIAIVVDEFGGTSGLVTLEDILEQVVGEITDEFDTEKLSYEQDADGAFTFPGHTGINDIQRIMDLPERAIKPFNNNQVRTISGIILELAKAIPAIGDSYTWDNYEISVTEIVDNQIRRAKIRRIS